MVYLNGKLLPVEEAHISVMDRGFLLGDGVYEVIPVYGGRLFRLPHHLQRLQYSLDAIRIKNPHDNTDWENIFNQLIDSNADHDQSIYLQVTRGAAAKRDHAFPEQVIPTVFAMCQPIAPLSDSMRRNGVRAITLEDIRWKRCDIKAITLLANVMLRQQAQEEGAAEAILVSHGYAHEGAASNLFIVKDNVIITPPKDTQLLPGVTRDLVLELARQGNFNINERAIKVSELENADEIWLTSSTKEVLAVTALNDQTVGNGTPGPLWHKIMQHYADYKQSLRNRQPDMPH